MAFREKETSPYFGVQKRQGGYVAETRNWIYKNMNLGKFYHRTADELEAAFLIDAIKHFGHNENYSCNFVNGKNVLIVLGSQYQKGLDERLAKSSLKGKEYRDHVSQEYKSFLVHDMKKLWEDHHQDILKDHVRPLYQGTSTPSSRQILGGERCTGEETEEDILRNTDNQGLSAKFDVDVGLVHRAPSNDDIQKNVLLPPGLKEHQGSHSNTQLNRHKDVDGSGSMSGANLDNMVPHMKTRCAEYENWWKVVTKFIASCSQERVMKVLIPEIAPILNVCVPREHPPELEGRDFKLMHVESQQRIQCAFYEKIYDIVTDFVNSECPPEEIYRYQAETGPIIQRCRANWYY